MTTRPGAMEGPSGQTERRLRREAAELYRWATEAPRPPGDTPWAPIAGALVAAYRAGIAYGVNRERTLRRRRAFKGRKP